MHGTVAEINADFSVLGPLRVMADGHEIEIATRRQRALLVLLLMSVGRVVSAERLIDQLWDGAPPPQATVTLRSYISNLRQSLGGKDGLGGSLTTRGQGYSLEVPPESIDAFRMRQLTERGRQHLRAGRADQALADLTAAVEAWAGDPLAEVADHEAAQSSIAQLTETYLGAVETRFEALLANGRHLDAIPGLEAFAADHPLREEPRALLMLALHRAGRAPEALEVHRRFRTLLQDELGIDPTPRLAKLVQAILEQDHSIDAPAALAPTRSVDSEPTVRIEPVDAQTGTTGLARQVVGRGAETERLLTQLSQVVRSRKGSLVLLAGEPGIGKTTMLELVEEHATARGAQVHVGRAPASPGAPTFWPWTQVLESIAATMDDETLARATSGVARPVAQLSPSIAERMGGHVPLTGDSPQALRFIVYEAVSTFLRQAAGTQPCVITLDDIHWADLPSLELLSYLTPTLEARPLLLVTAYRNLPADRSEALDATLATVSREDAAHEIILSGLAEEDIAAFTQDIFSSEGSSVDQERFASVLHERTGGNPFFVRQLARLILEGDKDPDVAVLSVPPGVGHVISQRVNRLSAAGKDFLSAAAVVGRAFDLRIAAVAATMDPDLALDAFDEAVRHGLVEPASSPGGMPHFVHALVQEVLLERLAAGRSSRLHARVADEYESKSAVAPGTLAEHLWAAREVVGARAVPAQLAAAEASAAMFSYAQAEVYLRRALHLVRTAAQHDPHTELMVLLSLFRLIAIDRGWGDEDASEVVNQATTLTQAGALADDTARLWWSLFFSMLDRDDTEGYVQVARTLSTTLADRADTSAGAGDADTVQPLGHAAHAAVHVMTVFERLADGDEEGAEAQLRLAREHVDAAAPAELAAYDEHLHVMLLLMEGYWSAILGDPETNRAATSAAIALADADGRPFPRAIARTLAVAGLPYLDDPLAEDAVARVTEALEFAHRFGFGWLAWSSSAFHAWVQALDGGDAAEAALSIEAFIEELRNAKRYGNLSICLLQLADVYLIQGRTEDARSVLREALDRPGPYRGMVTRTYQRRLERLTP